MSRNFISVVIVNWNGKRWLKDCFDSLYSQTYKNFEVLFIDNGSDDDSVEFVKKYYCETKITQNEKNLGFSLANNIGAKKSGGDILFFLNNDTRFPANMLEELVKYRKENQLNIAGPRILNFNGEDSNNGGFMSIDIVGSPGISYFKKNIFYIDGCSLMIGKDDFEALGGFDEKYFLYNEELDLCWRAHLYGMKMGVSEKSKLIHYGGGSSKKTQVVEGKKHITTMQRRFWAESHTLRNLLKNYKFINLIWILPLFFIQDIGESIIYLITGNIKMFIVIWKGFFWNIKNFSDTLKKRKIIQKKRIMGDKEVLSKIHLGFYKFEAFWQLGMPKFK